MKHVPSLRKKLERYILSGKKTPVGMACCPHLLYWVSAVLPGSYLCWGGKKSEIMSTSEFTFWRSLGNTSMVRTEREFPAGYEMWTCSCDKLRWSQTLSPCWALICGRRSPVFLNSQSFFHLPESSCWRCQLRASLVTSEWGERLYLLKVHGLTRNIPGKG